MNAYVYAAESPVCLVDSNGLDPSHPEDVDKHQCWNEGAPASSSSLPNAPASTTSAATGETAAPPPPEYLPAPGGPWNVDADRIVRRRYEAGAGPWKSPPDMKSKGDDLAKITGFDPGDRDLGHEPGTPHWKQKAGDQGVVRNERAKGPGGNRSKGLMVERPAAKAAGARGEYKRVGGSDPNAPPGARITPKSLPPNSTPPSPHAPTPASAGKVIPASKPSWDAKMVKGIGMFSMLMSAVAVIGELRALSRGEELHPNGYYDYGLGGRIISDFSKLPEGFSSHVIDAPGGHGSGFYEKKNGDIYKDGKLLHIMEGGKLVSGGA